MPQRPAAELLSLDNQLCFAVYAASRALTGLYRELLAELGLTYPQYLVMLVLWEHEEVSVKELGAALRLDSGTLSPLLRRLEGAGLVRRRRAGEDERVVRVALTGAGAALRERAVEVPECVLRAVDLPDARVTELRDLLGHLTETVGAAARELHEGAGQAPSADPRTIPEERG
ncbi:DNA-binding MarR family transcriptional regulator [Spinactinospora alkalitolerans]|uniref:DNA-binding MarR family transcriptional regulator n=1 Tax=Spinactinospora alkalitolerans TaxID=687207 RepID=A0A852TZF0_9ACTN|nr:MarR family transcriptional regulator [Spinactinospora alkalitolerans]NYE47344.1 DNA-binding MarR family transcriptional regulator [Spinactinospora alkalitolerans]